TAVITPDPTSSSAFWPFDNNVLDVNNGFNGTISGNLTYTTSFLGRGAAISFNRVSSS
ncbi:unnamed protein product, partial [Rotaria sp. Silwood2]